MEQLALHHYWSIANQNMVAKILSEFAYEQAFQFEKTEHGYQLKLKTALDIALTVRRISGVRL